MRILAVVLILMSLTSCWPTRVSFNDGSIPEEWEYFFVQTLDNNSSNTPLNYPVDLTEKLKDGLMNNTRLKIHPNEDSAQVYIEGIITNYTITPVAVQEGDNASKNRLTVSVSFKIFTAATAEEEESETALTSSKFIDYDSNTDLGTVENTLLGEVSDQIVQDVINKLLSNW